MAAIVVTNGIMETVLGLLLRILDSSSGFTVTFVAVRIIVLSRKDTAVDALLR